MSQRHIAGGAAAIAILAGGVNLTVTLTPAER